MAYLTVEDIRAEGVTEDEYDDDRVETCIAEAEAVCEQATGTWFDAREKTFSLDGNGSDRIFLPQPCVDLTSVTLDDVALALDDDAYLRPHPVTGRSIELARRDGARFTKGRDNLVVVGEFGTVVAGAEEGETAPPADILRALRRHVILLLPGQTDEDAAQERRFLTASSVSTDGRSATRQESWSPWSGDPEVDRVFARYRRPRAAVV